MSSLQEMEAHKGMDKPSLGETGVVFAGVLVPGMRSRIKVPRTLQYYGSRLQHKHSR